MAVYQPNELKMEDKKFSCIIYGAPGVGKTTLACSAPRPYLIDLDKGIERVNARHRVVCSRIDKYEELAEDFKTEAFQAAETVIIDTGGALITYLQDWAVRTDPANRMAKSNTISQKGWGAVKREFLHFVDTIKTNYNKNIIFIFHSVEEKDKDGNPNQRLLCEGSARNIVWQPCDFGGYVYMAGGQRKIAFTPGDTYFAKGCFGITGEHDIPVLTDTTPNTFMTQIFATARSNITAEKDFFEQEKRDYEAVMEQGRALVDGVNTTEDAARFAGELKKLTHVLTSETEIRSLFKERIHALGITWDKAAGQWIQKIPEVTKGGEYVEDKTDGQA